MEYVDVKTRPKLGLKRGKHGLGRSIRCGDIRHKFTMSIPSDQMACIYSTISYIVHMDK